MRVMLYNRPKNIMKKLLLITVLALVFTSCSFSEKKAQKAIKEYVKEIFHYPETYKSIEFGELDSTFSKVENDLEYIHYKISYESYINLFEKLMEEVKRKGDMPYTYSDYYTSETGFKFDKTYLEMYNDSATYYGKKHLDFKRNFKSEFNGWKMTNRFSIKNKSLKVEEVAYIFYFDKEISKVVDSEIIDYGK